VEPELVASEKDSEKIGKLIANHMQDIKDYYPFLTP